MKMALTSSARIPFTGTIQHVPQGYNNQTIGSYSNIVRNLPFLSSYIKWDNPTEVPRQLEVPLGELLQNQGDLYTVNTSMNIEIAGSSDRCFWQAPDVPMVTLTFYNANGYAIEEFTPTFFGQTKPYAFTGINLPGTSLNGISVNKTGLGVPNKVDISFDIKSSVKCDANNWTNAFLRLTLYIEVILNCTGKNLDTEICADYCNKNMGVCFEDQLKYCFPTSIGSSAQCQSFFANYIQKSGPDERIDQGLSQYCKKYKGLSDLLSNGTEKDIDLCACHLDPKQYQTFRESIIAAYPNIGSLPNIGLVQACLVPECADTNYTSTKTGKKCAIPQCLNIGAIGINGDVDRSNITIRQDSPGCANIGENRPKPTPTPPKPEPTPTPVPPKPTPTPTPTPVPPKPTPSQPEEEKKGGLSLWMIIGIVVLALIILIAVILLIVTLTKRPSAPSRSAQVMTPLISSR